MTEPNSKSIAIVGGGPAGLMAAEELVGHGLDVTLYDAMPAEELVGHGLDVTLYDAMPSLGRKFLMAGKSGLNLTHAEPFDAFLTRFGAAAPDLKPILEAFPPDAIRAWASELGIETFVGTSNRVFPNEMKAAPLLRAWLRRLRTGGLRVQARHRWSGWNEAGELTFDTPSGEIAMRPAVTVLALGGASWPKLGSDAAWAPWLVNRGVAVTTLAPANCGFDMDLSDYLFSHFEGQPLKGVAFSIDDHSARGDCALTKTGLEGGPIYALSAAIRWALKRDERATLIADLLPDLDKASLAARLSKPRGKKSLATHLKRTVGLSGLKAALLREGLNDPGILDDPAKLAARIKALPLGVLRPRPIAEAISTAGGVGWDQVTEGLELKAVPGVYVAGEMLDWDAPTGGYLLSACLATGKWAGAAIRHAIT